MALSPPKALEPLLPQSAPLAPAADQLPLNWDQLYREHAHTVARWIARLGGPDIEVDDVLHDLFCVALRKQYQFRREAATLTWLYAFVEREVRAARKRARRRRWLGGDARDVAGDVMSPDRAPDDAVFAKQAERLVYRALDGLGDKYREVFILFELEKLPGEEISKLTGIALPTVWVRLHRARAQFAARLEQLTGARR